MSSTNIGFHRDLAKARIIALVRSPLDVENYTDLLQTSLFNFFAFEDSFMLR